jgi:tRNA(fMet)-specific endonuclease VapC
LKKYLLDTNICIHFLGGEYDVNQKIEKIGNENCLVSEITIAELKFGAENSRDKEKNRKTIADFVKNFRSYRFSIH